MNHSMGLKTFFCSVNDFFAAGVAACFTSRRATVALQVTTQYGVLMEGEDDGVKKFLGVPFAQAPVGELRWKAPQPVLAWEGVREAKAFGDDPMQLNIFGDMAFRGSWPLPGVCLPEHLDGGEDNG